ncbi:hypothetical protein MBM_02216 [Drepanopeziza brunnea f. sp. 'multigermtubi' MB_m1]|uniref:Uncharacterized protein n=1 Tax=Marssonina brunnea f. sp. multigermtubi (strain MB_m1) TaxID=1072389 RepID=K1Y541_MARBU|nr:uncharacterized protein MBM_02216 [Drepanopeziza brunnea f. sp. 'multigermtubi' MB_m1]EKD20264.1 hypothetical protein MBM_02216 [Drepanopeziza brunnea f. sp. 'multigermtubi' MB_m1]
MSSHEDDGPSPLTRIAQLESFYAHVIQQPERFFGFPAFGFSAFRLFGSSGPFGFSPGPSYGFSSAPFGSFRFLKTAFARPRAPLSFGDLTDLSILKHLHLEHLQYAFGSFGAIELVALGNQTKTQLFGRSKSHPPACSSQFPRSASLSIYPLWCNQFGLLGAPSF